MHLAQDCRATGHIFLILEGPKHVYLQVTAVNLTMCSSDVAPSSSHQRGIRSLMLIEMALCSNCNVCRGRLAARHYPWGIFVKHQPPRKTAITSSFSNAKPTAFHPSHTDLSVLCPDYHASNPALFPYRPCAPNSHMATSASCMASDPSSKVRPRVSRPLRLLAPRCGATLFVSDESLNLGPDVIILVLTGYTCKRRPS